MIKTINWADEEDLLSQLMPFRIKNLMMISSLYDSFVFETDGLLSEQIAEDFKLLNLTILPNIVHCSTPNEVFNYLEQMKLEHYEDLSFPNIDLIIIQFSSMKKYALPLLQAFTERVPDIPIIGLISGSADLLYIENHQDELKPVKDFYFWNGNSKLFLAIIKQWEDQVNFYHDNDICPIPVILLIETYIPYYSRFLPLLYEEIMGLNRKIIHSVHFDYNKALYMRARPRVFLFHCFSDASQFISQYSKNIIGIISNINYRYHGIVYHEDGLKLAEFTRKKNPFIPVLLQSFNPKYEQISLDHQFDFLFKHQPDLQVQIRKWLEKRVGFGSFDFSENQDCHSLQAYDIYQFYNCLKLISQGSFEFHLRNNHYYHWFFTHGEILLSQVLEEMVLDNSEEDLRTALLNQIDSLIFYRQKNRIWLWDAQSHLQGDRIYKIGSGSVGGKGRGLQFLNVLIDRYLCRYDSTHFMMSNKSTYYKHVPHNVKIIVPTAVIIGTDEFDLFMEINPQLQEVLTMADEVIDNAFVQANLPESVGQALYQIVENSDCSLAVRSSSILEDSISNPFAGIFRTFLLPNSHQDHEVRLHQLHQAVKLVYSSMYARNARLYRESLHIPAREEKMSVIIQVIAGSQHKEYFYPLLSGVAQSYNFYPATYMKHEDGIVTLSAGLGKTAVERERTFAFCPKFPHIDFFQPLDIVSNAQRKAYVIDKTKHDFNLLDGEDAPLQKIRIDQKLKEGEMNILTSVWEPNEKEFLAGSYTQGPRVITYRPVLKYDQYPLADIIMEILSIGREVMGSEIEIEFAFDVDSKKEAVFYLLQIRPIAVKKRLSVESVESYLENERLILFSSYALGSEEETSLDTVVLIPPERFNILKTREMAMELEKINQRMRDEKRIFILIGAGRWGSSDPFLGVPVIWSQISQAKMIVEVVLPNYSIEASHGSHFFHNLFSMNVGYLTIWDKAEHDRIDWEWLSEQETEEEGEYFLVKRSREKLKILFDGKNSAIFY